MNPQDGPGSGRSGGMASRESGGSSFGRDWPRLTRLLSEMPPNAIEAEMSLLGSLFLEPAVMSDVLLVLRSGEDFFDSANGRIFDVLLELYDRNSTFDIVHVHQSLADRDLLETIGGIDYLVELAQSVPTAANAVHYARLVRQKAAIRSLIHAAGEILHDAFTNAESADDVLEAAEQRIYQIAQQAEQTHAQSMDQLVIEVLRVIEDHDGSLITGVPSGFCDLDEMTQGLQPGELLILAARPSMGKTAFVLNLAEHMAMANYPVVVFSLEMGRHQLVQRLLSARSGVDSQKIRRGMLNREDWQRLRKACSELHDSPIFIDDTPGLSLMQMRAKARRLCSRHGIKAIVIDYLQLMSSGRRVESRQVEIGEISRGIKAMARELSIPVICLSQLNRAAEQREGHRPRMSDLRESGSIEQDADVVMMLHREEYYHQSDPEWKLHNPDRVGVAELIIAKQRNGPTGTVYLTWVSEITRFRDHAPGGGYDGQSYGGDGSAYGAGAPEATDWAAPGKYAENFRPKSATGPVDDFRDGGGPPDDDEIPI